jgi:hypothetical protein
MAANNGSVVWRLAPARRERRTVVGDTEKEERVKSQAGRAKGGRAAAVVA